MVGTEILRCCLCGGEVRLLGYLGRTGHMECQQCGLDWVRLLDVEEEEDDDVRRAGVSAAQRGTCLAGSDSVPTSSVGERASMMKEASDRREAPPEQTLERRIWRRFMEKLASKHPDHPWTRVWLAEAGADGEAPPDSGQTPGKTGS